MEKNRIYLCLAHMSGHEMKYVQEAFDTNWVVPLGPNVNGFEKDLETFVGEGKRVVALSAGTAALHLALLYLGIKPGDEVICQSFTFAASCNPIVYLGATPVFVDSEEQTWNMDPNLLEDAIKDRIRKTGKKPKAVIPVYLYGMPAYIDEIMEIANRYEIPVVEDAAEAFGSVYKGKACGTFGKFGIMSFNGNKMITTSGGGALICEHEDIARKIMFYATQAREDKSYYLHREVGYNYRMSNICAGIGRGQMTVAAEHVAHHRHVKDLYVELLNGNETVEVHVEPEDCMESNYWLNTILLKDGGKSMPNGEPDERVEELRRHFDEKGIETRPLWKPMHTQPVFKDAPYYVNGTSERLFAKGLCLPSGPYVKDEDVRRIVSELNNYIGSK
ncbi:MAG: aminotransferase class I/II-fold pyridoxal phosphate-dependent enzyme [Prevotella sp.]|nr:aminotransferase class I/II-fold pyridoxal phosphate-dependent enzyme [Prevotella sp.]MDY6131318.1 aminotransferase class I/II-fold pyridoxal phosphate-dependent enzyme [Prevotella sp.]